MAKKTFTVAPGRNIDHDGRLYTAGETIDGLTADQAERLTARGALAADSAGEIVADAPLTVPPHSTADALAAANTQTATLGDSTVDELKAIATAEDIDLGGATKKADIVAAIEAGRASSADATA